LLSCKREEGVFLMTKSEIANLCTPVGIVFLIAGLVILVLAFLNYRQDGRVSSSFVMGLFIIFFGVFWYLYGKKLKAQDK
jgi:drug/metabolite transporter (DMT)-like permease